MARRTDWADHEANRLFDMVRDGESDDEVIHAIGKSLRRAAQDGRPLVACMHGPVGEEFE